MQTQVSTTMKTARLILNCLLLAIGNCGGPLIMRLYFIHGGERVWLSCWLEFIGFPIMLIPLTIAYFNRRAANPRAPVFYMKLRLFAAAVVLGVLTGVDNFLYASGVARLPVSTSALLVATQLVFTSTFAFLLVKQKFTSYMINAVVLLTVGAAVLALHTNGDRPSGESTGEYIKGFVMTLAAAALYGFIMPTVELTYMKAKQAITYTLVLEIQLVMCFCAALFCTVGMLINNDFKAIGRESRAFGLGEGRYFVVLVCSAIIWQCFFLGVIGVIFCASSLLSGIIITVSLPVTEILAVFFYNENFQVEKGVALFLSLWGFISYFYGELLKQKENKTAEMMARERLQEGLVDEAPIYMRCSREPEYQSDIEITDDDSNV